MSRLYAGFRNPKQRRTLVYFDVFAGYHMDDFQYNRKSVVVTFRLDRQKQRRRWVIKIPLPVFDNMPQLRFYIWKTFKKTFNIYR